MIVDSRRIFFALKEGNVKTNYDRSFNVTVLWGKNVQCFTLSLPQHVYVLSAVLFPRSRPAMLTNGYAFPGNEPEPLIACDLATCPGKLSNFKGNESRDPSSVPSPKQKPNIVVVVSKQLQSINFMLFFNNPIFLRKFPLIKLQRPRKNQQQLKISLNGLLYFALFIFRGFFRALPIPAVSQRSTLCARVLVKILQPISGFWDLSTMVVSDHVKLYFVYSLISCYFFCMRREMLR